jgi:hypothetical protein
VKIRILARSLRTDTGPIELPIAGRPVSTVTFARVVPLVRFQFWTDDLADPDYALYVDGQIKGTIAGKPVLVDPSGGLPAQLLEIVGTQIIRARALEEGALELEFGHGDQLFVDASKLAVGAGGFEPWQLCGEDGYRLVSIAGGGLSVWREDAPASLGPV